jgi:hypothetical protein
MDPHASVKRVGILLPALALSAALAGPALALGVQVELTTAALKVAPSTEFDVTVSIPAAGAPFNAFHIVVVYDPAALTYVQNSAQQGCLMTGSCSAACGQTFNMFAADGDSLVMDDFLMCDQVALTGPGPIYRVRFRTSSTPQTTWVRLRSAAFYNAGIFVTPVTTTDRQVDIGPTSDVGPGTPARDGLSLRAEPNPARGAVTLAIEAGAAGRQRVEVLDPAGRVMRVLGDGWQPVGARRLVWDGADPAGRRLPPGVYLVRVQGDDRGAYARVALLR